jgi:glycerophosphoryl diester phosphodiesterase
LSPALLEPFRRTAQRPLVYGHRGARARAPENTILAFDLALAEGADGVELDVRMTADGELVVLHDRHLQLEGGQAMEVERLTTSQLNLAGKRAGYTIPTLDEVLAWQRQRGCLANVELKGDVPQRSWLARRTAESILYHGTEGILISSFHPTLVLQMTRRLPTVPAALLLEPGSLNQVEHAIGGYRLLGACGVHPQHTLLNPAYFRPLEAARALVNTWTVNDEADAKRLANLGVDGIVTDRPLEILGALTALA